MKSGNEKGLTLIELVVCIAILSIIIIGSLSLLDFGDKTFSYGSKAGDLQSRAVNLAADISLEVRKCSSINVEPSGGTVVLEYYDGTAASIYKEGDKLVFSSQGQLKELASGVESVVFAGQPVIGIAEGIDMNIRLYEGGESFTFRTSIFRRT